MTIKQAIVYNLVSAVLAYLGLVAGVFAGEYENGRHFILSITAGLFLYIALADMVSLTSDMVSLTSESFCAMVYEELINSKYFQR